MQLSGATYEYGAITDRICRTADKIWLPSEQGRKELSSQPLLLVLPVTVSDNW